MRVSLGRTPLSVRAKKSALDGGLRGQEAVTPFEPSRVKAGGKHYFFKKI